MNAVAKERVEPHRRAMKERLQRAPPPPSEARPQGSAGDEQGGGTPSRTPTRKRSPMAEKAKEEELISR